MYSKNKYDCTRNKLNILQRDRNLQKLINGLLLNFKKKIFNLDVYN